MRRCVQACDKGTKIFTSAIATALRAHRRYDFSEPTIRTGVATKNILIWLCLFAPLSLNEQMKTSPTAIKNTSRAIPTMLSLLCASLLAVSLGGCADTYSYSAPEARYDTYHAPYYYPYYPWYSYYGGAYYGE